MATYCKYYKEEEYRSLDGGTTWTAMGVYRKGDLLEYDSPDCGYVPMERTISGTPYCSGYDKMVDVYDQVSYDSGQTWQTTATTTTLVEADSEDCGYVPPLPTGTKFRATYTGGTYSAACDGNTILTSGNTKPSGYDYSAMTTAQIGPCVTSLGENAFYQCTGLSSVNIPDSVTEIGNSAFTNCYSLSNVNIPDSVTAIGTRAFNGCTGLTSCTIGSGVTSISNSAFQNCRSLTSISIPSGVTIIGDSTFYNCRSLTSVTIGSGVTSIERYAFGYCSGLTSIDIPDNVTNIGNIAFYYCTALTSCTIGSGVTSIGRYAFYNCNHLTSVTVNATTPPTLGDSVFDSTNNCSIYVPSSSVNSYKSAWSSYSSRIQPLT